jgi:hypothetical protein
MDAWPVSAMHNVREFPVGKFGVGCGSESDLLLSSGATISVELSLQEELRLRERARELNVAPEELAAAVLKDGLATSDPDFNKILAAVLDKNRELYQRLA